MKRAIVVSVLSAMAVGGALAATSCSQSAVNVPVRTFERAQRMDVVCLRVLGAGPVPEPVKQAQCAPVPPGVLGADLPYHLFALVTQTARGEVAVVDLTTGSVIDGDRSTPGINFIPVGALPTDIVVAPDGQMTFAAAAEVNKPALYAIASKNLLGDLLSGPQDPKAGTVPTLPSLPVCALPQAPGRVFVIPRGNDYELAVVLPGDARSSAKVVTMDPRPFSRSAGVESSAGETYPAGQLKPCAITGLVELAGAPSAIPEPNAVWDDGVKYAAPDAAPLEPTPVAQGCSAAADAGAADAGDAGDAGGPDLLAANRPHASSAARDGTTLYVGDDGVPLVHVIDLSVAGKPKEIAPLVATSELDPRRTVAVGDVAVSPATSDYKKFVYALDKKEGSIIVYDVTDVGPQTAPRAPLLRPHPELNPFQPSDRIVFSVPVAALSFVRHDFPLTRVCDQAVTAARSGILCNPNPNAGPVEGPPEPSDLGVGMCYRANAPTPTSDVPKIDPKRLRGVFGFATLSNGTVVAIDVDDWDAPCRRPDPMNTNLNAIAPPEPSAGPGDLDPYHAPLAHIGGSASSPVTLEAFFPVSAPHRPRSLFFLRNDPQGGLHAPNLNSLPQLLSQNNALPTGGVAGQKNPIMLPTATFFPDPTYVKNPTESDPAKREESPAHNDKSLSLPRLASTDTTATPLQPGVRFSWEQPSVHLDQNWTVTFEGAIPSFDGAAFPTPIETSADKPYQTLTLRSATALFCRKGIEDYRVGTLRAQALLAEMQKQQIPPPARLDHRIADYVQITDEILDVADPYWREEEADSGCWDNIRSPEARHDVCLERYGVAADQAPQRDFPILEAYEDRLVVGRFSYPSAGPREVEAENEANVAELKRMRCCFHHQAHFKVRTGGLWLTAGSTVGYLHHVSAGDNGACAPSCVAREALLNARAPAVPWPTNLANAQPPSRNSVLAMRNPAFSFVIWNGRNENEDAPPQRDLQWKFVTRGQFQSLTVNIAATTTAVSPQSMRFIESLGQLALVDGASQGLVLIDLQTVSLAHTPFF